MFLRLAKRTLCPAILGLILVAPFALPTAPASARIDLNCQWQFRTDPVNQGEQQGWYKELPAAQLSALAPKTLDSRTAISGDMPLPVHQVKPPVARA